MRIAIIGSGISGLGAAWSLAPVHEVTVFEAEDRLGGHSHTLPLLVGDQPCAVDTGFMVFNALTYPHLLALFAELGIRWRETDMSLSVRNDAQDFEWSGQSLGSLFADKRNLLRPRFWFLLRDILRFNRLAPQWLQDHPHSEATLGELVHSWNFSSSFRDAYLLPMAAAIWSCPAKTVWDFPATTFIRFCVNHRLLQVVDRPVWRTVVGGAGQYVQAIRAQLTDVRLRQPVLAVRPGADGVTVATASSSEVFDAVILACHSDQAARMLPGDDGRQTWLRDIAYQDNRIVLHRDDSFMPRHRAAWSAWNVHAGSSSEAPVSVTYWLNRLQGVEVETPVLETLNPWREPEAGTILADFVFAHPLLDARAIKAQQRLEMLQGQQRIWLAGAWLGYGFHEDGLKAGLRAAYTLGGRRLPVGEHP